MKKEPTMGIKEFIRYINTNNKKWYVNKLEAMVNRGTCEPDVVEDLKHIKANNFVKFTMLVDEGIEIMIIDIEKIPSTAMLKYDAAECYTGHSNRIGLVNGRVKEITGHKNFRL